MKLSSQGIEALLLIVEQGSVSAAARQLGMKTGLNKPPIPQLRKVLADYPTYDRTI